MGFRQCLAPKPAHPLPTRHAVSLGICKVLFLLLASASALLCRWFSLETLLAAMARSGDIPIKASLILTENPGAQGPLKGVNNIY